MKTLLTAIVILTASLTLRADYLYWMIGDDLNVADYVDATQFRYASIKLTSPDEKELNSTTQPGGSVGEFIVELVKNGNGKWVTSGDGWYADVGVFPGIGSSFLLELYGEDGNRVAWSSVSGSVLNGHIATGTAGDQATPYGGWSVVPEPTSGLLTLCGLALLALKRKRTDEILV